MVSWGIKNNCGKIIYGGPELPRHSFYVTFSFSFFRNIALQLAVIFFVAMLIFAIAVGGVTAAVLSR